jgi:hypothetical protein
MWRASSAVFYAAGASLPFMFGGEGFALTPYAVAPIVLLIVMATMGILKRGALARPGALLYGLALLGLATFGVLTSGGETESVKRWLYHVLGFAALVATSQHMARGTLRWRDALIFSNVFAIALGLYFVTTSALAFREYGYAETLAQRYVGGVMSLPWGTTNLIAGVLLFPALLALSVAGSSDRWVRFTGILGAASGLIAIATTLSRTSIALAVFGTLVQVMGALRGRSSWRTVIVIAAAVALGAGVVARASGEGDSFLLGAFLERLDRGSADLNGRSEVWTSYIELIRRGTDYELMVGHGLFMSFATNGYSAHNLVLSLIYDVGLLGLVWAIALAVRGVMLLRRAPNAFAIGVAFLAVVACSMVEDIVYAQQSILYGWLMLGAIIHGARRPSATDPAVHGAKSTA